MATAKEGRPHQRLLRWSVIAATGAVAVGLSTLPATATPAPVQPATPVDPAAAPAEELTVDQVQQKVADLAHEMEVVIEQFNGAEVDLRAKKAQQQAAEAKVGTLNGQVEALGAEVRALASSAYRGVPTGQLTSLISSNSPDDLLDQLSVLDILSDRRQETLDGLTQAKTDAEAASQAAAAATTEAQRVYDEVVSKRTWIEQQLPKYRALLAQLTEEERQEAFNRAHGGGDDQPQPAPEPQPQPQEPAPSPTQGGGQETQPAPSPQAQGKAAIAVEAARSKLGRPYVWGAEGPSTFDCSGLTQWAWAQAGVSIPRTSQTQINFGQPVSRDALQPGDLVFFYPGITHVGMYIGGGQMIHAPMPGDVVKIAPVDWANYSGAIRVA